MKLNELRFNHTSGSWFVQGLPDVYEVVKILAHLF